MSNRSAELVELKRLRRLVDECLNGQAVYEAMFGVSRYVEEDRVVCEQTTWTVRHDSDSMVQVESVCGKEQSEDQPEIQARISGQANKLRPSRRDGLARKITDLYRVPGRDLVRDAMEKGWEVEHGTTVP